MTVGVDDGFMPLKDPEARRAYHRAYMERWYQQHRELQMRRVLKANRARRERGKQYVDQLKASAVPGLRRSVPALCDGL